VKRIIPVQGLYEIEQPHFDLVLFFLGLSLVPFSADAAAGSVTLSCFFGEFEASLATTTTLDALSVDFAGSFSDLTGLCVSLGFILDEDVLVLSISATVCSWSVVYDLLVNVIFTSCQ